MIDKSIAVGYIRVTTESEYKLAVQRKEIMEYCDNHNIALHEIFQDSGDLPIEERSGLSVALKTIKDGNAKYLITSKLSRISRKISEVVAVMKILEETDAFLISVKDGIDTSTEMAEYFTYISNALAAMEKRIS